MKKIITSILVICIATNINAQSQSKVRFIVKEKTAIHHDSIYITGSFNNWDSTANKNYLMKPDGLNETSIVLNLKAGHVSYKFTRGNWFTVEKQYWGGETPDRVINIDKDTTITDSVEAWRDLIITDKKYALSKQQSDTSRIPILAIIANLYAFYPEWYNADSALFYAQKALEVTQKIKSSDKYKLWMKNGYLSSLFNIQEITATLFHALGNYPKSLELRFENLKLAENGKNKSMTVQAMGNITNDYASMKDYREALHYGKLMDSIVSTMNVSHPYFKQAQWEAKNTTATAYYHLHVPDSALYYAKEMKAIQIKGIGDLATGDLLLANIYTEKGNSDAAFSFYRQAISAIPAYFDLTIAQVHDGMARLFQKENQPDSALYYARLALSFYQNNKADIKAWGENSATYIADISPLIADLYQVNHQPDSAYKYLRLSVTLKDSLYNVDKVRQFQTLTFNESARRQQLEQQSKEAHQQYENKVKMYLLITGMLAIMIVALILYRNNRNKRKANILLNKQKEKVESTLSELKSTQKQLIQSEKMASLGELTAGIAHEIQNPLNFVNNFSDVNAELIDEMKNELANGNGQEAMLIADDIKENEQKINHHGKRADAIVKGMLQHSKKSSGQKEPTDINALADEYLRLSYHGLRAKDKSFNATMKTDFDENIGKINIIPQDIGRVLLNLYNNAFYAVQQKQKLLTKDLPGFENLAGLDAYEPTVSVSTKKSENSVLITVSDNGNGIPQKVVDKIFQPFFTTKPTGEGTGLGLSLAYDIVKAHGGELKVETAESEFTEFIIQLPMK